MTKMNPVVHFEMPAEDRNRMAVFYQEAFGWKVQMLGPEMGEYVLVTTAESDAKPGAPAGAINGGFYLKRPDLPAQYPSIVIAVDDVDPAMKRVVQAGGKVLGEPFDIPGVGRYVSFFDINLWNNSLYASGDLVFTYSFDPVLQFLSASLPPDANSAGLLQWNLGPLAAHGHMSFSAQFQVPPDVGLIGTILNSQASVSNTEPEADLVNNSYPGSVTITGSLDPNDKSVRTSSGSSGNQYFDGLDEWVDYTIRFQNTGTDTSFTVVVRDTIGPEFDLLTTQILGSSHPMDADVRNPRVLTFTFSNILLPDSGTNEAASHGYVSFRLRPVDELLAGAMISNDADIYFDFNPPVITNNTELVVDLSTGELAKEEEDAALLVFPNPAGDELRVVLSDRTHKLFSADVLALDGRVVMRENEFLVSDALDTRELASGTYLLRLRDADGTLLQAPFVKR